MKKITIITIVILVWLTLSCFVPVLPYFTSNGSGIPGCKSIELRTLKSFFVFDEPAGIISWGRCYWD